MMHDKKTSRVRFTASLLGVVILVTGGLVSAAMGQETQQPEKPARLWQRRDDRRPQRTVAASHESEWRLMTPGSPYREPGLAARGAKAARATCAR